MMLIVAESTISELADIFRLLGDTTRLRITLCCRAHPIAVGDIAASLDISPSLVSHHLRLLRAARIVTADRRGKQVFYFVSDSHISRMVASMLEHLDEPRTDLD